MANFNVTDFKCIGCGSEDLHVYDDVDTSWRPLSAAEFAGQEKQLICECGACGFTGPLKLCFAAAQEGG